MLAKEHKRALPRNPTAGQVLYEIASIGGPIKNNGQPGWLVLRRGYDQLHQMERGWVLAQSMRRTQEEVFSPRGISKLASI